MRNPEQLINNGVFRQLVRRAGFLGARSVLRHTVVPLLLTPARRRTLRDRVTRYLTQYFPDFDTLEVQRRSDAFLEHYGQKLAEDCATVNLDSAAAHLRAVNEHVVFRGAQNFRRALDRGTGVLAVGAHLGSLVFGNPAFITLYLTVPPSRYPVTRICSEPDLARFPKVLQGFEDVLREYGADIAFILTHRERRPISEEMTEILAAGGLVTSNLDVLMGGGSRKEFAMFDGRARVRLPALVGAAKSALRTGATILPWVNLRTDAGFRFELEEPIGPVERLGSAVRDDHPAVEALCGKLVRILEGWIVAHPEQWAYWDRFHHRLVT
ncbi:MAG: hypothetical protein ABI333_12925 [bacterium]